MIKTLRWLLASIIFLSACGDADEAAEFSGLDENGCYPGEQYDPEEDVCFSDCETDAECAALDAEIDALAGATAGGIAGASAGGTVADEPSAPAAPTTEASPTAEPAPTVEATPTAEPSPPIEEELQLEVVESEADVGDFAAQEVGSEGDELPPFAVYGVGEDLELTLLDVVDDTAVDLDAYEAIWARIRSLLPPDILVEEVYQYQVFTDGPDETLAYVEPLPDDADHWLIAVDMADVEIVNDTLSDDVVFTIVHEFAHILTLESDQVPPDPEALAEEGSTIAASCSTFYTGEGCANSDSYINQFFDAYWVDIFDELRDIEQIEDRAEFEDAVYAFYEQYDDRFLSDYAATNPGEDIAESFAFFVLYEEPSGNTMADDKMRFFFDYPELVAIRDHIYSQMWE